MVLHYRSLGQGKPLVILHGLFGSGDNWHSFAKSISGQYQVIMMDIRNHGLSTHTPDFNYELISEDIADTLRSMEISSCYLMGHSMGGKAAAYFTLKYPEWVEKLIVLDIALKEYPPHHQRYFDAMLSMDLVATTNRMDADQWLQQYIDDTMVRQFILKNLVRTDEGQFRWRFHLASLYQHYHEINISIENNHPFTNPVLFIKGEKSNYILPDDMTGIKNCFPLAILETVPGAGHWVHADKPAELKELVLQFLN
ncbi:MAG: alpha/beta fold hydrolase [Saprospiraceae bacterium]|nr:alpha/beta fold hydrolase [Saprospiraceae bacterium]